MEDTDRTQFNKLFMRMAGVFNRPVDDELADAYFTALKPYTIQSISIAFNKAIESAEWFPKPVEVVDLLPKRQEPKSLDSQRLYSCTTCFDTEIVVRERFAKDGTSLGMFGSPCDCIGGQHLRASWQKGEGRTFADSARINTAKVREA